MTYRRCFADNTSFREREEIKFSKFQDILQNNRKKIFTWNGAGHQAVTIYLRNVTNDSLPLCLTLSVSLSASVSPFVPLSFKQPDCKHVSQYHTIPHSLAFRSPLPSNRTHPKSYFPNQSKKATVRKMTNRSKHFQGPALVTIALLVSSKDLQNCDHSHGLHTEFSRAMCQVLI